MIKELVRGGIPKGVAKRAMKEKMDKDKRCAIKYLEKNPELRERINNLTAKLSVEYPEINDIKYFTCWAALSGFSEAIRLYTTRDDEIGYILFEKFPRQIDKVKGYWNEIPEALQKEMILLLKEAYDKNQGLVEEVLDYVENRVENSIS